MSKGAAPLRVAWLPGDGIGREVSEAALSVVDALCREAGVALSVEEAAIGGAGLDACGDPFPEATAEAIYHLWLGASLVASLAHDDAALAAAMRTTKRLVPPGPSA